MTWDAIEHAGPGEYDTEYLAYLRELLASLKGTGLVAYVVSIYEGQPGYCEPSACLGVAP